MKYSPKRTDNAIRAIYAVLLITTVLFAGTGSGITKAILSSLALISLTASLYLFIRYDMTSYTYILSEKNGGYDFYIDKYVGKRGGYVCFYPISDSVMFEKYEKSMKKSLRQKYGNVHFYNYSQNIIKADKSIIVFENTDYFDAVIFEPDKDFSDMIRKAAEVSVKATDGNGESTQTSEN
ncbi:MAG: hypothetical protein ACI3XS_04890 [Eubacteriales bacterium]